MSRMRAVMCGDCMNFKTIDCKLSKEVNKTTWAITLDCEDYVGSTNKGVCLICGKRIPKDKVRCSCTFDGEYMD